MDDHCVALLLLCCAAAAAAVVRFPREKAKKRLLESKESERLAKMTGEEKGRENGSREERRGDDTAREGERERDAGATGMRGEREVAVVRRKE